MNSCDQPREANRKSLLSNLRHFKKTFLFQNQPPCSLRTGPFGPPTLGIQKFRHQNLLIAFEYRVSSLVPHFFFSVNGVTYLSSNIIYKNKSPLAKCNLSLSDELSYFDIMMQKNNTVRESFKVTSDFRYL